MESLQARRERTDLIDSYKFLNGLYKTHPEHFFSAPSMQMRGHSKKLFQRRTCTKLAGHFFSNRVVKPWNNLPEEVVSAPTVDTFKRKLRALPNGKEG